MKLNGKMIFVRMAEMGLSKKDLAGRSGVASSTIRDAINGTRETAPLTVKRLAEALNVPVQDLVEGTKM